jgi:hypothetical protein
LFNCFANQTTTKPNSYDENIHNKVRNHIRLYCDGVGFGGLRTAAIRPEAGAGTWDDGKGRAGIDFGLSSRPQGRL